MGEPPCDALEAEIALDRIEAELAVELPAHMRAFADAYVAGRPLPTAPLVARLPAALRVARNACMHDVLCERGITLLRLVAPLVIDDDPRVRALSTRARTWAALDELAVARDAISTVTFGCSAVALAHRLHGIVDEPRAPVATWIPARVAGWDAAHAAADAAELERVLREVLARFAVDGAVRLVRLAHDGKARTFVVEPGREVIVAIPRRIDTPAARFVVMHELGHAVAALACPVALPRPLDEAVASLTARLLEDESHRWFSPMARAARERRLAVARILDAIERHRRADFVPPLPAPPHALWDDPGSQASYVMAESIADRLQGERLEVALAREKSQLDRSSRV